MSMDFSYNGKKTIQDENQRVIKTYRRQPELQRECEKLKERNKVLENMPEGFCGGKKEIIQK